MFVDQFHTREAHEKRPKSDVLNTHLIFQKQVFGRVIIYDEKSYIKTLSKGAIHHVLQRLQSLMREDINRFYQNDENNFFGYPSTPSRVLELIIDTYEVQTFIEQCVFERNMTFTEAYQLALKLYFQREKENLNKFNSKIVTQVLEYMRQLNMRFTSNVRRVLLEKMQRKLNYDFILVIDQFMPEVFFQPSDHLKGIIYRKKLRQEVFNHFAIYYQIPIVYSQEKLEDGDSVILDVATEKIILNPTEAQMTQYVNLVNAGQRCYFRDPFEGTKYEIHAMITNFRDVRHASSDFVFQHAILYYTDVVVAAKGAVLTEQEWEHRLDYIFKMFKGEEIIVRLPGFDNFMTLDELCGRQASIEMYGDHPDYFEPLVKAISEVYKKYPNKKVTIVVPHLMFQMDYETWQVHLNDAFELYGIKKHVKVIFECDNERAMHEVDALLKSEGILVNVDYLATTYIPDFMLSRDPITREMIYVYNIFSDLQYTKFITRNASSRPRNILMGFNLQTPTVLRRLIITGFKELIIPIQTPHHFIDIIDKRLKNKGKYVGVYEKDRERTLFYREYKKKNNFQLGQKRPWGLYKKLKEEEEKRLKEEEDKKKEEEKKEMEDKEKNSSENNGTNE